MTLCSVCVWGGVHVCVLGGWVSGSVHECVRVWCVCVCMCACFVWIT